MPTITLNKSVLEKLVGKKLSLDQLKDRISMLGTDLEKIEGDEIVVEIFPNRPDMLSEQGFARALSSFIGVKTGLRRYDVAQSGLKVIIDDSVQGIRPFTACAAVKNLMLDKEKIDELVHIQEKLHITYGRNRKKCALGMYPMEKIAFPVTYKADLPEKIKFRPLESNRVMTASQILEEHKTGKEYAHLLQGLQRYPFFIDAKGEILSMPPIINSDRTGKVTASTKDLFIECSGFDFETLSICLNIIVTALADMGGKIYSIELDYGKEKKSTPFLTPRRIVLDLSYVNKRLGLNMKEKEAARLLEKMGYGFETGEALIPAYRADILHQVDMVEDLAIAYGYENFAAEIPTVATIGEEDRVEQFSRTIKDILTGLGLLEVKNYHLMMADELNRRMNASWRTIPLKNAVGDYNHLRNSLFPSLLKTLSENQHQQYPQNLFEIGRIFEYGKSDTGVVETQQLGMLLCHEKTDFTEIKQIADALLKALGLELTVKENRHPSFINGRMGDIIVRGKKIGIIGEIHPQVLVNWSMMMPVVGLEINVEKLRSAV